MRLLVKVDDPPVLRQWRRVEREVQRPGFRFRRVARLVALGHEEVAQVRSLPREPVAGGVNDDLDHVPEERELPRLFPAPQDRRRKGFFVGAPGHDPPHDELGNPLVAPQPARVLVHKQAGQFADCRQQWREPYQGSPAPRVRSAAGVCCVRRPREPLHDVDQGHCYSHCRCHEPPVLDIRPRGRVVRTSPGGRHREARRQDSQRGSHSDVCQEWPGGEVYCPRSCLRRHTPSGMLLRRTL